MSREPVLRLRATRVEEGREQFLRLFLRRGRLIRRKNRHLSARACLRLDCALCDQATGIGLRSSQSFVCFAFSLVVTLDSDSVICSLEV